MDKKAIRMPWSVVICIALIGCIPAARTAPVSTDPIDPTMEALPDLSPATALSGTTQTTQYETLTAPARETATSLPGHHPDLGLQPITAQNINKIAPVAVLQDSGVFGSILSPDGRWFAVSLQYSVSVYDASTAEEVASFATNGPALMAFSLDGSKLATMSTRPNPPDVVVLRTDKSGTTHVRDRYVLTVWHLSSKRTLFSKNVEELCGEKPAIDLFQFLDDSSLALSSLDYDARIQRVCRISAEDGASIDRLNLDQARGYVRSLAISSDGRTLAAAFSSGPMDYLNPMLTVFRFPDGEVLFEKPVPIMPELDFIDQTQRLLYNTINVDGQTAIEILSPAAVLVQTIPVSGDPNKAEWFAANERYMVVPGNGETIVYELVNGTETFRIPHVKQIETIFPAGADAWGYSQYSLARSNDLLLVHQDCTQAACRDVDEMVRIIDLAHPSRDLSRLEIPFWFATASGGDLSPDGRLAAVGGLWNGDVCVWSTQNGQLLMRLQDHQGLVYQVVFSPDGSQLATVSADGTARLWDFANGKLLRTLTGHQGWVLRAAFSPDGTRLITSGEDNSLRLWDVATGQELHSFPNPKPDYIIDGLWFTSKNTLLLKSADLSEICAGCHSTAFQIEIESGSVTELPWEHLVATGSHDGNWLLRYGTADYRVLDIGRVEAGQMVIEKSIPLSALNDSQEVAISPDGQWIYTFNANGLNVIDRATGEQIALSANYLGVLTSGNGRLEAAPDGRFLVNFTGGNVVLWGIPE